MPLKSVTSSPRPAPRDTSLPALYSNDKQLVVVFSIGPLRGCRAVTVSAMDDTMIGYVNTYNDLMHVEQHWTRCPAGTTVTLTQEAP